jgi:hypothetical protein
MNDAPTATNAPATIAAHEAAGLPPEIGIEDSIPGV